MASTKGNFAMMTLIQILRRTSRLRKANARYVKLAKTKTGLTKKGQPFIAAQTHSTHTMDHRGQVWKYRGPRPKYVTVIVFLDRRGHVEMSCSCPDFKYRAEFALTNKGAATIEYSNGLPPVITNPMMIPYCCRHLVKLSAVASETIQKDMPGIFSPVSRS